VILRHLQYFIVVAEEQSITRASLKLGIAQPSLSRQMKHLEEELALPLFIRGAKSIQLSHEGKLFLQEARKIDASVKNSLKSFRHKLGQGTIHIGYFPAISGRTLQKALPLFTAKHPNTRITLHDLTSAKMREALIRGEIDLIIDDRGEKGEIEWHDLGEIARNYSVHQDSPLFDHSSISPSQVKDHKFVLPNRYEYPTYWQNNTMYFSKHNVTLRVAGEFTDIESLNTALRANLGISIMATIAKLSSRCKRIPADPPLPSANIAAGIANHTALRPELAELLGIIQSNFVNAP